MRRRLPRTRLHAGWLYVVAGLALCAAGILVPARQDVEHLRRQRDRLADEKASGLDRLAAYENFLRRLDEDDPALIRRLAAAQLNLVPADEKPMLLAASRTANVTSWIDGNVPDRPAAAPPQRVTLLGRVVGGPGRLWVLAAGMVVVFLGLLLDDFRVPARNQRRPRPVVPRWPVAPAAARRRRTAGRAGDLAACADGDLNPWYDE